MSEIAMAIIGLLKEMGGWGAGSLLAILLMVPPLTGFFAFMCGIRAIRSLEKVMTAGVAESRLLFVEMSTKYDNNIIFVQNYEKLARNQQALAENMLDSIKENVKVLTLNVAGIEAMQRGNR